ncbi:MAG: XdhC family protein [Chloroflexi bacterium]|nr:XdhC family protein [Chloroflexota bacterium]
MSELDDILSAADAADARGEPVALATVVAVRGSSYRRPGARLLVPAEGRPIGLISGGCLEEEAARLAREAIRLDEPIIVTIDHSAEGDELWGIGLGCRGVVELLAEPPSMAAGTLSALRAARDGVPSYLVTELGGDRRELTESEAIALGERASAAVRRGQPVRIGEAVLDPILPPLRLVICGAGPDAPPLAAAGKRLGWRVTVVDPRRTLLRAERFPGVELLDVEPADAAATVDADEWTAVVVMSHDYVRDAAFLSGLTGRRVGYLGVLGPRDRTERLLAESGASGESITTALHAPAGLDIGADGAEEVATAITAEILAVLRGGSGVPLRERPGPIHP